MPAPTTTDQLYECLRKSGLVPPATLDALLSDVPADGGPRAVLDRCVAAGALTPFQADRIAAGKYKGFVLGGYVILDRLGGGGMGQVYLAEHSAMRRHVAVKVLASAGGPENVALERFLREARAAAVLNHPNIIRVFDLRQDRQVVYMVMEYVPGVNLHHLVGRIGPLDPRVAAHYGRQVALGLQHAHEHNLVHRDVKPANLLVAGDGTVKILDLGLVRFAGQTDSKLTSLVDKTILGTADFLAPEQAMDSSSVDTRADIYSLGATLYYLLAGRALFPDGKTAQKLLWQQMREPIPLRKVRPDVPEGLAAVVHRALRKDVRDRFQTPTDLAAALSKWATGPVPRPESGVLPPPPPRWSGAAVAGGTGGALTVSCAAIELPPLPTRLAEPKPRAMTPTVNDLDTATPRLAPVPAECKTPVLMPRPDALTATPPPQGPVPLVLRGDRVGNLVAAGLLAIGFVAGAFAQWLSGVILK
jgi:serine/threonine-protein kinase